MLELVQNADDNEYEDGVTPKLNIVYRRDGHLWFGCNEIGFYAENVRAICCIGVSTKRTGGSRRGYIGEKGIGFKSVFRVADIVWIRSGALEFQFDKRKRLGMVAPEWNRFEAHDAMDDQTMFCFKIPDERHRDAVLEDLMDLNSELLLFLRKLKAIEVHIETADGKKETSFELLREDSELCDFRLVTLSYNTGGRNTSNYYEKFLLHRQTASDMPDMPADSCRFGVTDTDVAIAFPITDDIWPIIEDQWTFNYLPIRHYGLPVRISTLHANPEVY